MGVGTPRILFRHLMPRLVPLLLSQFVRAAVVAVVVQSGVAFLGLGDPARPSWGTTLYFANNGNAILTDAWLWWVVPPGVGAGGAHRRPGLRRLCTRGVGRTAPGVTWVAAPCRPSAECRSAATGPGRRRARHPGSHGDLRRSRRRPHHVRSEVARRGRRRRRTSELLAGGRGCGLVGGGRRGFGGRRPRATARPGGRIRLREVDARQRRPRLVAPPGPGGRRDGDARRPGSPPPGTTRPRGAAGPGGSRSFPRRR